jgi:DegV family protein with EDD domain
MAPHRIAIVTDSSAYIPTEAVSDYHITVIPVWMIWDGENLRDGVDIDPTSFYQRLATSKTLPTTSQPTPGEFVSIFKQESETADTIVCVLVSSKLSGTYESAMMAKEQLPNLDIRIVDSAFSSMGLGFCVLAAAQAAESGKSADEVVAAAVQMSHKMHLLIVVDTLEFLHRSGRIKATKRALGTLLQVKPILHFEEGLIQSLSSERTMKKALSRMLDIAEKRLGDKKMAQAAVVDVDAKNRGDQVAEIIHDRFTPPNILRSGVSPVVGAIVGPGTIGVAFYSED